MLGGPLDFVRLAAGLVLAMILASGCLGSTEAEPAPQADKPEERPFRSCSIQANGNEGTVFIPGCVTQSFWLNETVSSAAFRLGANATGMSFELSADGLTSGSLTMSGLGTASTTRVEEVFIGRFSDGGPGDLEPSSQSFVAKRFWAYCGPAEMDLEFDATLSELPSKWVLQVRVHELAGHDTHPLEHACTDSWGW